MATEEVSMTPFEPAHFWLLELRDLELQGPLGTAKGALAFREAAKQSSLAVTLWAGQTPLAICGLRDLEDGAELWMVPSKAILAHRGAFARAAKRLVNAIMLDRPLRYLQTFAPDDSEHGRWMEWLGFKPEGDAIWHSQRYWRYFKREAVSSVGSPSNGRPEKSPAPQRSKVA